MNDRRRTEDLIGALAAAPLPEPFRPGRTLAAMLCVMLAGLGLYLAIFGIRPDLGAAWAKLAVQAKTILPALLSLSAIWLALRSARPEGRVMLWLLALPGAVAGAMVLYRLSGADGLSLAGMAGQTALACLGSIVLLSALPLAAGIVLFRRSAPTRPVVTGALLGLATAAAVASGYALHCTEDSPLFFVAWYGGAICLVGGIGAVAGHRFLRW